MRRNSSRFSPVSPALLPFLGLTSTVAIWWFVTVVLLPDVPLISDLTPAATLNGFIGLIRSGTLIPDASASMFRLVGGLFIAVGLGVGLGIIIGVNAAIDAATRPILLFLRMVSPLSWAPLAIGVFGIGNSPVIALVATTALWPIVLATSEGIGHIDSRLLVVARAFGATRVQVGYRVVWPSIRPRVLGGIRSAIGVAWVVLVPAEMFGVTSGLGYQILNSKDQLAYDRLGALLVVIGTLGYCVDVLARWLLRTPRERREESQSAHASYSDLQGVPS
ncbi:Bicarbonate transport system permease protein CmpB [Dermatophilus congolensis]|uniref:Bicarbonate transport system permease protein CmpB n=1 Tax=Dermatophilus congolensis TaxID=1863 RepID=A0AA46H184_9MICO|nr:Bicarbonate transport system permease protein CmpB [Dermatophilus congolensis]